MVEKKTAVSFRQVRKVSGFSRPMSPWDAFVYNFLTMGVIFPWAYLWGPASFPGGSLELAIGLTFLAQVPISFAYCFLATTLPVTGGDYVYQSRAFGKWGFVIVMSGFVIWILQWVALSGWLFATLGLAPWLLTTGVLSGTPTLSRWALTVQSPAGVFTTSVLLALFTTLFLIRGLRLYVRVQKLLFALTIAAVGGVLWIFLFKAGHLASNLADFVRTFVSQTGFKAPPEMSVDFHKYILADVRKAGVNLTPPFSLLATLGIVPIVWTSLQWATYSVEQNTEIAEADRFRKQVFILVGSAFFVALLLFLVAYCERRALGGEFMQAVSSAYWSQSGSPQTVAMVKTGLQPFPNIVAMAGGGSIFLATIIALGFLANAFQITCNCFIGVTRIMVAMATDGLLPPALGIDRVDPVRHSPVRAHWLYLAASLPWIAAYNFIPQWVTYSLGVTFACGYVFAFSALAGTRIPTKLRASWINSDIYNINPKIIKATGYLGFGIGMIMVLAYLVLPQLGLTGTVPYFIVAGIILFSYGLYVIARSRSSLVEKSLQEVPIEIEHFYTKSASNDPD